MTPENLAPLPVPPPIPQTRTISEPDLICPQEKSRFVILLVFSVVVWLLLAITVFGFFYALLIGFFVWFAGGLLVARLRAESVEITPKQMPELYGVFLEVCQRLGEKELPKLYVTQSGGILNAFAMRHLARNFVVIYSELLSACGTNSPEIRFILGHEVGHIRRNHVLKHLLLFPGLLLPLIGNAYRRACEKTSDRYGAYAAGNGEGAVRAMLLLAAGPGNHRIVSPEAFADQHQSERGFFVSLHELFSMYPTLSQRVAYLRALTTGAPEPRVSRHPLAYFLALFSASGPQALLVNVIVIYLIFILALAVVPTLLKRNDHSLGLLNQSGDLSEQKSAPATVVLPPLSQRTHPIEWVGKWSHQGPGGASDVVRNEDGSYRNEDEESDGDWWITDGIYYHMENELVYRYNFSWKDPATHKQLELTGMKTGAKVTETKE
jgi:Zn-dependent protease with chaperone function